MASLLTAALSRAHSFLLEPERAAERISAPGDGAGAGDGAGPGVSPRPDPARNDPLAVVLLGLSTGCGVSTLAGGLTATLAVPAGSSVQLLAVGASRERSAVAGRALGGGLRWDVPLALRCADEVAEYGRMVERLTGAPATMVWDVPSARAESAAAAARAADVVVAVAPGDGEPALAELVAGMLGDRFGCVLLAANRVRDPDGWGGRAAVCVPESRIGAMLAARGRRPGGAFGAALGELARLVDRERG